MNGFGNSGRLSQDNVVSVLTNASSEMSLFYKCYSGFQMLFLSEFFLLIVAFLPLLFMKFVASLYPK